MIKKLLAESKKIEENDFSDDKDPSLLILEMDRQMTKLENLKQKLSESDDERLERIKNLLKAN